MRTSNFFRSFAGFGTVAVLTLGVVFGVTLVKQEQDIRNQAAELKEHKVNVCHKTGSESNSWEQIEISENALESHLSHGDIQGNCPTSSDDKDKAKGENKDKDKGKGDDNKDNGRGGPSGGVSLANNVTVNNTSLAASEVKVETKYVYVTTAFDFKIAFQGITDKKPDKTVRVIFRRGEEELHVYNKVEVKGDAKGIYRGVIADVKPGVYEVLIKGDGFLQRKFENVDLKKGKNVFDWSKDALLAGDFNADNIINARDLAEFLSFYNQVLTPVTSENRDFDVNMDNQIDLEDLKYVFENYNSLELRGEE